MSVYQPTSMRAGRPQTRPVAFYDLDGTLAELNLVNMALFVLSNLGEWSARIGYLLAFLARIPGLYLAEQRDRYLLNIALFEVFKGVSRDRLEILGEEYCERVLIPHLYPQAVDVLNGNRAMGFEPVLVTGSPDFIVAPLARHLEIAAFAANRLAFSRGRATGRLREPVIAGSEKAAWCAAYAAERRTELAACWAYADSYYDLPFLAAVGHPVAVNPDRRLLSSAVSRRWPIIHFANARRGFGSRLGSGRVEKWLGRAVDGARGS